MKKLIGLNSNPDYSVGMIGKNWMLGGTPLLFVRLWGKRDDRYITKNN
jgi:hypothetical protein